MDSYGLLTAVSRVHDRVVRVVALVQQGYAQNGLWSACVAVRGHDPAAARQGQIRLALDHVFEWVEDAAVQVVYHSLHPVQRELPHDVGGVVEAVDEYAANVQRRVDAVRVQRDYFRAAAKQGTFQTNSKLDKLDSFRQNLI